jgi:ABC-2 type transport system ATP-binding protein
MVLVAMIEIENLTKYYSKKSPPALDDVSFEVRDGEIVGYVGLNGAGKTTTIKIAVGVLLPSSGTVYIDGHDIVREKVKASERVGWLPELPNFNLNEKALNLMMYYAGFHGLGGRQAEERCLTLLRRVGLEGHENTRLREYSMGMKKRFSLAVSMISDPSNYLFDEVLNGLDPEGIRFFRELALEFKKEGRAVLFSSHILSEVETIADKIVFIHKGRIIDIIRSKDLSKFGGLVIELTIDNIDNKLENILDSYGKVEVSGDTVIIYDSKASAYEVNKALVENGYRVSSLQSRRIELEEYFLKLVGGEGNA